MHTPDKPRDDACAQGDGEFNADLERLVVVDGSKMEIFVSIFKYYFIISY